MVLEAESQTLTHRLVEIRETISRAAWHRPSKEEVVNASIDIHRPGTGATHKSKMTVKQGCDAQGHESDEKILRSDYLLLANQSLVDRTEIKDLRRIRSSPDKRFSSTVPCSSTDSLSRSGHRSTALRSHLSTRAHTSMDHSKSVSEFLPSLGLQTRDCGKQSLSKSSQISCSATLTGSRNGFPFLCSPSILRNRTTDCLSDITSSIATIETARNAEDSCVVAHNLLLPRGIKAGVVYRKLIPITTDPKTNCSDTMISSGNITVTSSAHGFPSEGSIDSSNK